MFITMVVVVFVCVSSGATSGGAEVLHQLLQSECAGGAVDAFSSAKESHGPSFEGESVAFEHSVHASDRLCENARWLLLLRAPRARLTCTGDAVLLLTPRTERRLQRTELLLVALCAVHRAALTMIMLSFYVCFPY